MPTLLVSERLRIHQTVIKHNPFIKLAVAETGSSDNATRFGKSALVQPEIAPAFRVE
jgi:hypothetical protein